MKRFFVLSVCLNLFFGIVPSSAAPVLGAKCSQIGVEVKISGRSHTCVKSKETAIWSLTSNLKKQTFEFSSALTKTLSSGISSQVSLPLLFKTNSPLAFEITSITPSVCLISKQSVQVLSGGDCKLTVQQDGSSRYRPYFKTLSLRIEKKSQSLVIDSRTSNLINGTSVTINSQILADFKMDSNTSPLIQVSPVRICTLQNALILTHTPGDCIISISHPGDSFALPFKKDLVLQVQRGVQSLNVSPVSSVQLYSPHSELLSQFRISASSSSGLAPVIDSATQKVCSITELGLVQLLNAGQCILELQQPGNDLYQPSELKRVIFEARPDCKLSWTNLIFSNIPEHPQPTAKWTCYTGKRLIASPWCCTYTPDLFAYEYVNGSRIQRSISAGGGSMFIYEDGEWVRLSKTLNTSYAFGRNFPAGGGICQTSSATGIKTCQEGGVDITEISMDVPGLRNYCFATPSGISRQETYCISTFQIQWIPFRD